MELEQTWFPHGGGTNWKKIGIIAFILLAIAGGFAYYLHRQNESTKTKLDNTDESKTDDSGKKA